MIHKQVYTTKRGNYILPADESRYTAMRNMLAKMAQECIFTKARGCSKCVPRTLKKMRYFATHLRISARQGELECPFLFLSTKFRLDREFWQYCRSFCRLKMLHCRVLRLLLFLLLSEPCLFDAPFLDHRFHIRKRVSRDWGLNFRGFKNDHLYSEITNVYGQEIMTISSGVYLWKIKLWSQSAFLKKVFARYIFSLIHAR